MKTTAPQRGVRAAGLETGAERYRKIFAELSTIVALPQIAGTCDDGRLPGTGVMIEFPTADAARSWYDDPADDRLKHLCRAGSEFDLLLVDGLSVRT